MAESRSISYGLAASPPEQEISSFVQMPHNNQYEIGGAHQPVEPSSISQNQARISAAFDYNSTVPGINGHDFTAGASPFPILPEHVNRYSSHSARSFQHEGSLNPYSTNHTSHLTARYEPHREASPQGQLSYQYPVSKTSQESHLVEEGELSEGEFIDTPPEPVSAPVYNRHYGRGAYSNADYTAYGGSLHEEPQPAALTGESDHSFPLYIPNHLLRYLWTFIRA